MVKVLVTTVPFGEVNDAPIKILKDSGFEFVINPLGRKLQPEELKDMVKGFDAVIAGTEKINLSVIEAADQLKIISRVGIGVDSVDLNMAAEKRIAVSYTPDAPAPAVAELALAHIMSLLRNLNLANLSMHNGTWKRYQGLRVENVVFGIVGLGRIGRRVLEFLDCLGARSILVSEVEPSKLRGLPQSARVTSFDELVQSADLITIHVPLTGATNDLFTLRDMEKMKNTSFLVNTSRGGVVNERDLALSLKKGFIQGAGVDVFESEPYSGPLSGLDNCLLSCHMGSMSVDCRAQMELEATEEVIRFLKSGFQQSPVPQIEYDLQKNNFREF